MAVTNGDYTCPPTPLRVLQITDTHLFGDEQGELGGVNTEFSCRHVFDLVADEALPADLLLLTGDLVHDSSLAAYRRLQVRAEALGIPGLVIPGNHDNIDVMRQVFSAGAVRWQGHMAVGGWVMVMLNSTLPGQPDGHLTAEELQRLETVLAQHPGHHALICLHHHPRSIGSDWIDGIGVDNGDALFAVLDRHPGVRAVIWGHVHQEYSGRHGDIELLACPSTCLQFAPGSTEFTVDAEAPGYRALELYADGRIETWVKRLEAVPDNVNLRLGGY